MSQSIIELEEVLSAIGNQPEPNLSEHLDALNTLIWALREEDLQRGKELIADVEELINSPEFQQNFYKRGLIYHLRNRSWYYWLSGQLQSAQETAERGLAMAQEESLLPPQSGFQETLGAVCLKQGRLSDALENFVRQYEIGKTIDDIHDQATALNNIGAVYKIEENLERAEQALVESRNLYAVIDDQAGFVRASLNLAAVWNALEKREEALAILPEVLRAAESIHFQEAIPYILTHLGETNSDLGNFEQAIPYLYRALANVPKNENPSVHLNILLTLGKVFHEFGKAVAEGKVPEMQDLFETYSNEIGGNPAIHYLSTVTEMAERRGEKEELRNGLELLAKEYEQQGNPIAALRYYKEYFALDRQIFNEQTKERLHALQVKHDLAYAQQKAEIAHLKNVELRQKIEEHAKARSQLERQLEYVYALSAFSQILLMPAGNEEDQRRILAKALQQLIVPTRSSAIFIFENLEDPQMEFSFRAFATAYAPDNLAEFEDVEGMARFSQIFLQPSKDAPSVPLHSQTAIIPWSISPAKIRQKLAGGFPIGGAIKTLYEDNPIWQDYLLNEVHVFSIQFFPILIDEDWWGFIALYDRVQERAWDEDEILLMDAATEMVISTLRRWQAELQLRQINEKLEQEVEKRTDELSNTVTLLQKEIKERERAETEIQNMVELLEERVAERSRELAALYDMTILYTEAQSLAKTLEPVLRNIQRNETGSAIAVHILSADKNRLQLAAQHGLNDRDKLDDVTISTDFKNWLNQSDTPIMIVDKNDFNSFMLQLLQLPDFPTYFGMVLRVRGEAIGLLSVYRNFSKPFSLENVSLLITMAEQMAIIIQNQILQEQSLDMTRVLERQRLARELHDSVAQRVYSLLLFARSGLDAAEDNDLEEASLRLRQIHTNTLFALREMRLLLYQLRPLALESQTLIAAFEERFDQVERRLGIEAVVSATSNLELDEPDEEELYFIITEALNNALKHAEASRVELFFAVENNELEVIIRDNGRGFDPKEQSPGLGLGNIYSRTENFDGEVTLESLIGEGTTIRINKYLGENAF